MVIDCGAPSICEGYRVKQDLLRFLEPLGEKEVFISSIQNYLEIAPSSLLPPPAFPPASPAPHAWALDISLYEGFLCDNLLLIF